MARFDTTVPPARDDVESDLTARFGADARLRGRGRLRPLRPRGTERTALSGEVLSDGRVRRVWIDLPLASPSGPPPADFRILAVIAAHNEEDIIGWTVRRLVTQGVEVAVLDHASRDGTPAALDRLEAEGLLAWREDVPEEAMWDDVLRRKVEVVEELGADWGIHNDADEVRTSPWPGTSLRDGLWTAHTAGADLVDFTVVNHLPVRGQPAGPPDQLVHVDLGLRPGYFTQAKAWQQRPGVDPGASGGHWFGHEGARVFPLLFRCDHYPVRSQAHGERKIAERRERRARERERFPHRHRQYDHVDDDHDFLVGPGELPIDSPAWATTNRARLLFRSGMEPDPDYELV